jgi:hypothetical protein
MKPDGCRLEKQKQLPGSPMDEAIEKVLKLLNKTISSKLMNPSPKGFEIIARICTLPESKLWFHALDSILEFAIVVIEANKLPWQINSQVHVSKEVKRAVSRNICLVKLRQHPNRNLIFP